MTFLPCAVLLYFPLFCASLPIASFNGTSVPSTLDASSPFCNDTRTLWSIVWSCAATLFACTWTAVHPNIPGIDEKKFPVACRRLFIMVMALIAPELMITWATRQFLSAQKAARDFNKLPREILESEKRKSATPKEWTVTHGYFAWMGGFILYVDGIPRATLTPEELRDFVRDRKVDMPDITEKEIEDRSKGDGLSKTIAIIQLAWFVLQLLARYVQNLQATLLEIDTLAIVALTCIAYCLWWKKPKNIGCPYVVHWKETTPPSSLTYDTAESDFSEGGCLAYLLYLIYPLISLMGIETIISPRAAHSRRVPSLGGYDHGRTSHKVTLFMGCFSGMLFGGINCLGWYFLFHSQPEQILWRAASLVIVCTPASISLFVGFLWFHDDPIPEALEEEPDTLGEKPETPEEEPETLGVEPEIPGVEPETPGVEPRIPGVDPETPEEEPEAPEEESKTPGERTIADIITDVIGYSLFGAGVITCIAYIPARIALFALMVQSLRSLPSGNAIFETVVWTKFIPHY